MLAALATNPQKSIVKASAAKKIVEFPLNVFRQPLALRGQIVPKPRVVLLYQLVKQALFRLAALVTRRNRRYRHPVSTLEAFSII